MLLASSGEALHVRDPAQEQASQIAGKTLRFRLFAKVLGELMCCLVQLHRTVRACACMYVCMYICMCVCVYGMYLGVHVHVCVCVYILSLPHARTCTHTRMHMHTHRIKMYKHGA